MADIVDTMGGDLEINNLRQPTSNAPSIWDRLPYNIGMELHHCASADNYTVTHTAVNSVSNCYQQLHTIPPIEDETKTSTSPPSSSPPNTIAINSKISESNDSSRGTHDSQGPTCIPLLPPTYQQHYLPFLLNPNSNTNSNDMKIDRNFKYSKSITSPEDGDLKQQHDQDNITSASQQSTAIEQSPNNKNNTSPNLLPRTAAVVEASEPPRFNENTDDNRGTCTKKFPVDNRISNKKNLVIKFNETQSTTTPKTMTTGMSTVTSVRRKTPLGGGAADGAIDRHRSTCDFDENRTSNHDSDMTAITTTTSSTTMPTRTNMSAVNRVASMTATASASALASATMVGSTSRRLNCCPTVPRTTTSSTTTSSSVLATVRAMVTAVTVASSALHAGDILRKFHITMRKDKKTMTAATMLYLILYIFTSATCTAARQDASNCSFPQRWEGSWFLSGYQQSIHIKGSQFSYRGKCAASDGNKYLIVDEKGCHRCLVIYEKHKNVLQYKESECEGDSMYMHQSNPSAMAMRSILKSDHRGGAHPNLNGHSRLSSSDQYIMRSNDDMNDCPPDFCKGRDTLQSLCDQIPGDALLYSLFRENAEPVKCPLKGPFVFTYNRGHGECKSPVSNIESCTEDSRLLLSFQACPDVQGTESTVEELTCLATWKDGNSRYLVGLVSHHHAISNEERYRCFVYEKISSLMGGPGILSSKDAEYKLAQSGDATCNGLDSAEVGSRIMSLRKPPPAERCDFPVWFKGPRHWHALMGNYIYNYHPNDGSMHIIKSNGYMDTRALCEQINKQTATEMMAVVHYTTGCQSGFMCMIFYRRDTHVIEIQTGKQASRLEDACAPDHFDINKMPYITLLASNPDPQICPLEGLYHLRGAIGPPYISSRHKRNHNNNKGHTQHGHHHHDVAHKRHTTLSFRNSDESGHTSWHSNTKGFPIRSRRDANSPTVAAEVSVVEAPPLSESSSSASASASSSSSFSPVATIGEAVVALKSGSPLSVNAIETNDLNHHGTDGDDTTSSLLLKLPPRQLSHDNVQSGRITIATGSSSSSSNPTTINQVKESIQQQQQQSKHPQKRQHPDYRQAIVSGIISNSSDSSSSSSSSSSRHEGDTGVVRLNETTRVVLAQRSRRDAPGCIVNYKAQRQLWIGCTGPDLIDVRPQCNEEGDEEYSCHGSWSENGTVYVIARHKGTKHGVCISYRPLEGTAAKLVIGDACYRGVLKPPEHHLVANLTVLGKCGESSSAHSVRSTSASWLTLLLIAACIVLPIQLFTNR